MLAISEVSCFVLAKRVCRGSEEVPSTKEVRFVCRTCRKGLNSGFVKAIRSGILRAGVYLYRWVSRQVRVIKV